MRLNTCTLFVFGGLILSGFCLFQAGAAEPISPAPVPVVFDQIQVQGEVAVRLARNFDRLEEEKYQPDNVFLTLAQSHGWPGDTEGRTILGLTLDAEATHRTPKYLEEILRRLPEKVNAKGYFGNILAAGTVDEQQLSGNGWVLRGLCEYYLWKRDPRCLEWINRMVDNLVLPTRGLHHQYPIDPKQRAAGGGASGSISRQIGPWLVSSDVGCDFIFLDGVVQAYAVTHREELKPVIDEMVGRFLQIDLRAIKAQTHASLTALRALLRYYEITGDLKLLAAVRERFALYRQYGMTENYENYNWFDRPEWTEPCAVVDSYLLAVGLWRWTGDTDYLELAERIYYNGLAFEQRANGGFGTQKCSGAGTPFVTVDSQEAYWCCTMRGAEGLARAAQSGFFTDAKGLYAVRFNNAIVKTSFDERGILELSEKTGYPFAGKVQFTVRSNTLSFAPLIRLFAPKWTSQPVITLNGQRIPACLKNGFACITEPLRAGDVIAYDFQIGSGALPVEGRESAAGWRKLYYGPLLLAAEAGTETRLPPSPLVRLLPDHTFRVAGLGTVFGTVYHLLDARVKCEPTNEPPYQVQMLYKSRTATAPPVAKASAATTETVTGPELHPRTTDD
jgi:hypothetical protein